MRSGRHIYTVIWFLLLLNSSLEAQTYDLLIRNGHVIDPKHGINGRRDIGISNGKISRVAAAIPVTSAKKVIDASGLYVTPGLIDIHTHVFVGTRPEKFADGVYSLSPDDFSFKSGVTTVVDAGTSGWRNFRKFKEQVIDRSQTRILAFLNISGTGLSGKPDEENTEDMLVDSTAGMARGFNDIIVGIKIGHYEKPGWTPFDRALQAAALSAKPLFVECHLPHLSLEDQLKKMRPGDIITHSFEQVSERMPVIDEKGKLRPFVIEARERGILFDLGHGGAGFWFSQAIPALRQGLSPYTFGSDLHRFSMNAGMKSMTNIMSKYMAMGMKLEDVVVRATWNPARAIQREDLGHLGEGAVADLAILNLLSGDFGFVDAGGNRIKGKQKLESELTIRNGRVVWDLNGLGAKEFVRE